MPQLEANGYEDVVAALSDPSFYPHAPARVDRRETHTSCVFIAGALAYKLKKPVRFEFLDYSTLSARRRMCREEMRLNRRLAPEIYLGVRSVVPGGDTLALGGPDDPEAVEYLVEMRRFAERLTLAAQIAEVAGGVERIREAAARIAAFHAEAERVDDEADPRAPLRRAADETLASLIELLPASREPDIVAARRFTDGFLARRRDTMLLRAREGLVRDGHGDLRAEHVLLTRPIEIVDCIEFDPALRRQDVAADLAFLVMDLHRLGVPQLARELVESYRLEGGDAGDDGLISFHAAQRAWVRAKVALIRAQQLGGANAGSTEARELLALARMFAWRARQPLMLVVCGLSGAGKSHVAAALAAASGFEVLSSDVVRKRLAGIEPEDKADPERYTPAFSAQTYAELGRLAATELDRSGAVIVDATFRHAQERAAFRGAAGDAARHAVFVECVAPERVRLARVTQRAETDSVSDATASIARSQTFDPLFELPAESHLVLRTDLPAPACVASLEAWLDRPPS